MNSRAVAKAIFDLTGILAVLSACLTGGTLLLLLGYGIYNATLGASDHDTHPHLFIMLIMLLPIAVSFALLLTLAILCRRQAQRLEHSTPGTTDQHIVIDQRQVFTLFSGVVGFVLLLVVFMRLINEGDVRWAQGMAIDSRQIPWLSYIDLACYAAIGFTLFTRPHLLYALWRRWQKPPPAENQQPSRRGRRHLHR